MLKITTFWVFFFLHIKLLNFITSVKFKANYKVSCLLKKNHTRKTKPTDFNRGKQYFSSAAQRLDDCEF